MKQSGFGVAALILGIIGILLSCIAIGIVPSIAGLVLAIIGIFQKERGHGTAIGGLVCSVIGIGIFLLAVFALGDYGKESTISSNSMSVNAESSISTETSNDGVKEDLASQMEVTEYSFENTIGDTLYFLVVKNNSSETVEINVNAVAKDKDGKNIGATDAAENAVGSGAEVCLCNYFDGVKDADSFEYTMTVKKDNFFKPVIQDLNIEKSETDEKVILTCTNNGDKTAQFVEAYALFFKDGNLINYASTYITDDDSEIKPGATISGELNCYDSYDDVKVYVSGRR